MVGEEMDSGEVKEERRYSSLKISLVTIQLLCTVLFSGILYGWAPFQLIMIQEGLYECPSHENDENNQNGDEDDENECLSQQANLTMLFTIATSTFLISSLFIGIFVDHYGPTLTIILNGIVVSSSLFLIAVSPVRYEGLFVLIALLLGLGGGLTLIGAFPLAFVVDSSHMPIIMSAINCFFDASAVIFLFCYLIFIHLKVSRLVLFLVFGLIAVVLYVTLSVLWYLTEPEFNQKKTMTSEFNLEVATSQPSPSTVTSPLPSSLSTSIPTPSITTVHSQHWFKNFTTRLFYFLSFYGALQVLRFNSFFGSVLQLLEYLGDESYHYLYTQIFVAMLPLGFLCLPIIDWIFQKYGFIGAFHTVNFLSIGYNIFVLIPWLPLQIITFLFFVFGRAILYSLIGTYVAHMFGPLNSGKMYGSFSWVAAFANVLQYPLFIVVNQVAPGYKGLTYLNIFFLCLCAPLLWSCHHDLQIILRSYSNSDIKVEKKYEYHQPDGQLISRDIIVEKDENDGVGTFNILHGKKSTPVECMEA